MSDPSKRSLLPFPRELSEGVGVGGRSPGAFIEIVNLDPDQIPNSFLSVSAGLISAHGAATSAGPYQPGAYLPRMPWSAPDDGSIQKLIRHGMPLRQPRCGIFHLGQALTQALIADIQIPVPGYDSQVLTQDLPHDAWTVILDEICRRFQATQLPVIHGGLWDAPGLETVTVDSKSKMFLGLHLDSWNGSNYFERQQGLTRICINCGPACRDLLVVPLSLLDIAQAVDAEDMFEGDEVQAAVLRFFGCYPDFPVFRLRLRPGDGYIADTDNLVHDGSSADASQPALSITMRGDFAAFNHRGD